MTFLYLAVNLCAVALPALFSFHPRIRFWTCWPAFGAAGLTAGSAFILWDALFAHLGVWGFDARYVTGVYAGPLPLEELLFFVCIPFACVFTYHCFTKVFNVAVSARRARSLSIVIGCIAAGLGVAALPRLYTSSACLACSVLFFAFRESAIMRGLYPTLLALLPMFFLVNGVLTGSGIPGEVVWYNGAENLGVRAGTIPLEDFFFALAMILSYTLVYDRALRPAAQAR